MIWENFWGKNEKTMGKPRQTPGKLQGQGAKLRMIQEMWERSGKEPGMIWEYLEQVGTSMGMAGEKVNTFVTQTNARFKCFDMGLHVIS